MQKLLDLTKIPKLLAYKSGKLKNQGSENCKDRSLPKEVDEKQERVRGESNGKGKLIVVVREDSLEDVQQ
jgi:hypothetical protein